MKVDKYCLSENPAHNSGKLELNLEHSRVVRSRILRKYSILLEFVQTGLELVWPHRFVDAMADPRDLDVEMEDDYDEEADSDFEGVNADEEIISSSSDEEDAAQNSTGRRPTKRRKLAKPKKVEEDIPALDSGDEATIKEREKYLKKQKKRGEEVDDDLDAQAEGWRAKTRSMRDKDKEEKKKSRLATVKGSTIDVNKIWEDMNRSGPLPPPRIEVLETVDTEVATMQPALLQPQAPVGVDENALEETITIKRTYKFAGEVHTEEKVVAKSSAEARLWLSQQSFHSQTALGSDATLRRPLRRISRFDPNHNNLAAFHKNWSKAGGKAGKAGFDAPKLNTVEKSKQDWAAHVDQEGLQEELQEAAKAKGGYLGRQDFLNEVEQKRETDARAARLKGKVSA